MAEQDNGQAAAGNEKEQAEQQFAMQRIYLKDLSYETPMGVNAFKQQWKPKVNQELNTKTNKLDDNNFEVVLTLTITVQLEEETAFLTEVQQAGIFMIKGLEGQQLAQVLNTTCPQILFPYAREAIDNVITKGSFPALMLPPINFDVLFAQAVAKAKADSEKADPTVN